MMADKASTQRGQFVSQWSSRYRGATVEDLDPPAALSLNPSDPISMALVSAFERDYTHLTIVDSEHRGLLGYISIPHLQSLLDSGRCKTDDPLSAAMVKFQRRGKKYKVITLQTPLEELEAFFRGSPDMSSSSSSSDIPSKSTSSSGTENSSDGWKQEFAVVTDDARKFVLGVATIQDLEEFVKRRPA